MSKATDADFKPAEGIVCGTCGEREASFEVSIRVQKGFDYQHAKTLAQVSYAVCEQCARSVVQVQLGAELRNSLRRRL